MSLFPKAPSFSRWKFGLCELWAQLSPFYVSLTIRGLIYMCLEGFQHFKCDRAFPLYPLKMDVVLSEWEPAIHSLPINWL